MTWAYFYTPLCGCFFHLSLFVKMGKALEKSKREEIVELLNNGKSYRDIARKVQCSFGSVSNIAKFHRKTGGVVQRDRSKCGRKPSLTKRDIRRKTVPELTAEINLCRKTPVSSSVVRRALKKVNLIGCVAARKPLL